MNYGNRQGKGSSELSDDESKMVARYCEKSGYTVNFLSRRSDRLYDVELKVFNSCGGATVWLPLGMIKEFTEWSGWASGIASQTDHWSLVSAGDWGGVRDSEVSTLWAIFYSAVVGAQLEECGCCGGLHRPSFRGDCRDDSERFEVPVNALYKDLDLSEDSDDSED